MERKLSFSTEEATETISIDLPKIYSKTAVLCFSLFFWNLAGGVLLANSLFKLKKNNEALLVLLFSFAFTAAELYIVYLINLPGLAAFFIHLFGAAILAQFFYTKYIPDYKNYPNKKIWMPLIVCIVLTILCLIIAFFPVLIYFL